MADLTYTNFTKGLAVLNPTDPDGVAFFTADSSGVYSNGVLVATQTVGSSITAHAGGGQGSGTALTAKYNLVTVCASNFDSVVLPTAVAAKATLVKNIGAAILSVFPATGAAINAMAVNLSIDIPVGGEVLFTAISAVLWETNTALDLPSPSTQKGNLVIKAADSAGDTQTLITNASQAAARTYTIPDAGASTNFVMGAGTQTVAGATTFTLAVPISATSNQLALGTTNITTINASAPAASHTVTLPDPLGADSFTLNALASTLTNKTITGAINTGTVRSSTQLDKATNVSPASIVGLTTTLVASGVYKIKAHLPVTSGASGGVKVQFATTDTLTLTSSNITAFFYNTAVSPVVVTTTSGLATALGATQIVISVVIEATMVVNAAGTLVIQGAQNASDGTTTSFYVGGYMEVTRLS